MTAAARCLPPLAAALLAVAVAHAADEPKPPPPACTSTEHRQFDFWLGNWEVRDPAGKVVGQNRLTSLHKGCVMAENWAGAGGFSGSSLNAWDADHRKWRQAWMDSGGGVLLLDGGWADGKMVLSGESMTEGRPGEATINRISWTPLPDGRVRQLWEASTDKGRTWTVAFDGYYTKVK